MGHLGFSYVGLVYLLMLFLPNILWARQRPQGYDEIVRDEPKSFLWLERLGQVSVTCCALFFADTNLRPISWWSIWLAASLCCMVLYEMTWIRYFFSARNLWDFYRALGPIPVPLAVLPVLGFFFLGIYGKFLWLFIAAAILGIGHIGIHWLHWQNLKK